MRLERQPSGEGHLLPVVGTGFDFRHLHSTSQSFLQSCEIHSLLASMVHQAHTRCACVRAGTRFMPIKSFFKKWLEIGDLAPKKRKRKKKKKDCPSLGWGPPFPGPCFCREAREYSYCVYCADSNHPCKELAPSTLLAYPVMLLP